MFKAIKLVQDEGTQRKREHEQARLEAELELQRQGEADARATKQVAEAAERLAREAEARAAEEAEERRIAEMRREAEERDRRQCKSRTLPKAQPPSRHRGPIGAREEVGKAVQRRTLCKFWSEGACRRPHGMCTFAHGKHEIGTVPGTVRDSPILIYERGGGTVGRFGR